MRNTVNFAAQIRTPNDIIQRLNSQSSDDSMIQEIVRAIEAKLKEIAPDLTEDQRRRMYRILNSNNCNFESYGVKVAEIEHVVRSLEKKFQCSYEEATKVFKKLMSSHVHEQKFAGFFFLNRFKKHFNETTVEIFYEALKHHCDTWATCDTCCIRVIGPYLARNNALAGYTIAKWSQSEDLWIRRASMVILLKIIMIKKDFDEDYVFHLVETLLEQPEDYILKGAGWLLKTCSKYKPDVIFGYLYENRTQLPRLVLRYGSEKLSKEKRARILEK